jgi:quercetin dioxygenase-like cupin family protein
VNSPSEPGTTPQGFVLDKDQGDAYWWLGSLAINKVVGESTHGGLSIVESLVPAGYAPPVHIHNGKDETFYILEGRFSFVCGAQSWQVTPGSLVFLPRDVPHGFRVSDDGPGRLLLIGNPAGFEELIHELGDPAPQTEIPGPDIPMPDPDRVSEVWAAHGITIAAPGSTPMP